MREIVPAEKPFQYDPAELVILGEPTRDQFIEFGNTLRAIDTARQWWIGDYLLSFEERYSEDFESFIDEADYKKSWNVYKWVSKRISPITRVMGLSWTHHRLIAELEKPDQEHWLQEAVNNVWSTRELREQLNGVKQLEAPRPGCMKCPSCGYEWEHETRDRASIPALGR